MSVNDILGLFTTTGCLIESVEEFNSACSHIVLLLEEAESIYHLGGYSTATFLAITAIEETAKAHLGAFTDGVSGPKNRSDHVFFNHAKKHRMAAMPTVSMGSRLQAAIGSDMLAQLLEMSCNQGMQDIRKSSLYFDRRGGAFLSPRVVIDKKFSRSVLLYAIEVFDDALVGFTDYSMKISDRTDKLFERVEAS
jgi:AbiV family abortive infection protein